MRVVNLSSKQMWQYLPIAYQNDLLNLGDKAEYKTTEGLELSLSLLQGDRVTAG